MAKILFYRRSRDPGQNAERERAENPLPLHGLLFKLLIRVYIVQAETSDFVDYLKNLKIREVNRFGGVVVLLFEVL